VPVLDDSPPSPSPFPSNRSGAWAVVEPFQRFLHTESSGGIVLLVAAVVALVWANSAWSASYETLWTTRAGVEIGSFALHEDLRHWVNDLAMALFFFVVGLEIKREIVHGDLREPRAALLPVACALGGMVVPAALFFALNAGGAGAGGWGIPMATDIAFSLGVLALLGRRAPAPLKAFLLALAIVDDIGAILVIAVFYSGGVAFNWLAGALVALGVVAVLKRLRVRSLIPYVALAAIVWVMTFESGVHATLAGVALGLMAPAIPLERPAAVRRAAADALANPELFDPVDEEWDQEAFLELSRRSREAVSPQARMERALHPWSAMVVLPLFALANSGVPLSGAPTGDAARVSLGVVAGLVVGKPVGVLLAALVAVGVARATLPPGVRWRHMLGVGLLAGIGFTVSLFITGLAFEGELADGAKLGVLGSSVVAGMAGAAVLTTARRSADTTAPATD
jgi:NhaA family Na+:H+ antiporter